MHYEGNDKQGGGAKGSETSAPSVTTHCQGACGQAGMQVESLREESEPTGGLRGSCGDEPAKGSARTLSGLALSDEAQRPPHRDGMSAMPSMFAPRWWTL